MKRLDPRVFTPRMVRSFGGAFFINRRSCEGSVFILTCHIINQEHEGFERNIL